MASFTKSDIQRVAVSAISALTVSAACVFGAVGPVHAATPTPATVPTWQAVVEQRIDDAAPDFNQRFAAPVDGQAEVALHFAADGRFAGADLLRSSGRHALDRRAVSFARRLSYPLLPETLRGRAQDVTMRLRFDGDTPERVHAPDRVQMAAR